MSIFISYRRQDGSGYAGRVFDRLKVRFGSDRVFMDVTDIEPGLDFVDAIEKALDSCDALVVVIGRQWSRLLAERAGEDDPDFVGLEIATALDRDVRVVPVLVGNAAMPRAGDLPERLKKLARRQAIAISDDRWEFDVDRLIGALERVVEAPAEAAAVATDASRTAQGGPAAPERTDLVPPSSAAERTDPVPPSAASERTDLVPPSEPAEPAAPVPPSAADERVRFIPDLSLIEKVDHRTWQWSGEFPAPPEEAVEIAHRGLVAAGMSNAVASRDRVTANVGGSIWSQGEEVRVEFAPVDESSSMATVVSRSAVSTTLIDWGKNRTNVETIIAALASAISG